MNTAQYSFGWDGVTRSIIVTRTDNGPCAMFLGQAGTKCRHIQVPEHITVAQVQDGINRWLGGSLIQQALPWMAREEREFLVTGRTPAEQQAAIERWEAEEAQMEGN